MLTQFVRMINGNCKARKIPALVVESPMVHLSEQVNARTAEGD